VRGVLAPIIGFSVLASGLSIDNLSYISAGMIILSAILLIPAIRQTQNKNSNSKK